MDASRSSARGSALAQATISRHRTRATAEALSLEVWQQVALVLQLHLELTLGRDPLEEPADSGHLGIQELVLRLGRSIGVRTNLRARDQALQPDALHRRGSDRRRQPAPDPGGVRERLRQRQRLGPIQRSQARRGRGAGRSPLATASPTPSIRSGSSEPRVATARCSRATRSSSPTRFHGKQPRLGQGAHQRHRKPGPKRARPRLV